MLLLAQYEKTVVAVAVAAAAEESLEMLLKLLQIRDEGTDNLTNTCMLLNTCISIQSSFQVQFQASYLIL